MKTRERLLIMVFAFVSASGGYLIGRISAGKDDSSKEAQLIPTKNDFHISMSENSKPEEGLYLISFKSSARHMYHFTANYGFVLRENAEGFNYSSKSSPHGEFTGFALAPHTSTELQARLLPKVGYLEEQFGMEQKIYPSPNDTVYLQGFARVSDFENGICQEIDFSFPLETPLKEFLDEKSLRKLKEEFSKPFDYTKLPPITE
jgi:hypothetical protein